MEGIKTANLFIWLGTDVLFGLNLKQLLLSKLSKVKPQLGKAISLRDIEKSDEYPSRRGLFVLDSKLHFFGGEYISQKGHYLRFNKKIFTINLLPSHNPVHPTSFPCHSGNKCRPIVFTISNKVYALSTILSSSNLENLFEVFEPEVGKWRSLPLPPFPVLSSIRSHCVFQNNLLITTYFGDYIFNTKMEKWMPFDKFADSKICALLEYKDHILVLHRDPLELVAYELYSFDISSAPSADYGVQLDIADEYSDFSELNISWASFNIIENNYISLLFISTHNIHVSLFRFVSKDVTYGTCAFVEAYHEFDIPRNCHPDYYFPLYSTFVLCTKAQESPTAISQLDTNRDRYLYISLGYDNLFSLNFNELCSGKDDKLDLKLHHTHYKRGADFPIGMGLFFSGSKLHFFGGENLEEGKYEFSDHRLGRFRQLQMYAGLDNDVRPKYNQQGHGSKNPKINCDEEWGNKKVFSFNLFPDFTRVNNSNSSLIPNHSRCMFRPLVFTISNKVYALSTGPLSIHFSSIDQDDEKLKLFGVYDLVEKKWRDLEDPHPDLCELIRNDFLRIRSQCVFRNKLLLQTDDYGYFLYDSDSGDWDRVDDSYPLILAGLEYNDEYLLILTRESCNRTRKTKLVAYESASFGKDKSIPTNLYIYNNGVDLCSINTKTSFQLVDDNLINLIFLTFDMKIHVMLLKVDIPLRYAVVEIHQVVDIPKEFHLFNHELNSTFLWQSNVIQHDTKVDPREEKRTRHGMKVRIEEGCVSLRRKKRIF